MTINNLTIQAQEALQSAMSLATGHGQQAVEPLHILEAIVTEDDSVGVYLLQKLGEHQRVALDAQTGDRPTAQSFGR